MNIVYLVDYDLGKESGVTQKILRQARHWGQRGHRVTIASRKTLTICDTDRQVLERLPAARYPDGRLGTALGLLINSLRMPQLIDIAQPDVIYMRYGLYTPFANRVLRGVKTIMEINSDDTVEYRLKSSLTHNYNMTTRDFLLHRVDAFVCVSRELGDTFQRWDKPTEIIANGIDIGSFEPVTPNNRRPTLAFIGTPNQPWHGLDKIKSLARRFPEFQFHLIGENGESEQNLTFHGYLPLDAATKIVRSCDLGIGTLSLHRKQMNEASPLKTRQYLACGLPIIYAYEDTDIADKVDFALRLRNVEENLDYNSIGEFVRKVWNNKLVREQARQFAIARLDSGAKEDRRLAFMERVVDAA